jgi:aldose 1-epimerase
MKRQATRTRGAGVLLGMSAMVAGAPGRAASGGDAAGFAAEVQPDARTGWDIIVLRYRDPGAPARSIEVKVAPDAGGNLFSWNVDGNELLLQPATLGELKEQRAGTPLMFPTVNRVRDAHMVFEGRDFSFEPNSGKNFIHGLARRRPFAVGPVAAKPSVATAQVALDWDDRQPDFAHFPIKHRLTLSFTLRKASLQIAYQVDNLDRVRLPFGFGLHPYFRIPGDRDGVTVTAPLDKRMEAIEYLPTGTLLPVANTTYDLRQGRPLSQLLLDDAYFGMTPDKAATFTLAATGLRVQLGGSADFTHLVVYTPPDKPFFCIENQTSSTDAHNLYARGKKREAHLQVIAPGKSKSGVVTWTIRRR